jgi:hypothetical protein
MSAPTLAPAGGSGTARPSAAQQETIQGLLHNRPARCQRDALVVLYGTHRTTEAAWLCAYARAAGLEVRLVAAARNAPAIQRRLGQEAADRAAVFVLADLTVDLPPGVVQLAGSPGVSPLDLWQRQPLIRDQVRATAGALPRELHIGTAGGASLAVRVGTAGWLADTGLRQDGQSWVLPAGTVQADVARASGTFVADGAIAVNRPLNMDARLATRPVTLTVQDMVVTSVTCPDPELLLFLRRAFQVHRAGHVRAVRIGSNQLTPGFSPDQGPVNVCHPGVTIRLSADPALAYSPASADLRIDLTASRDLTTSREGDGRDLETKPVSADR